MTKEPTSPWPRAIVLFYVAFAVAMGAFVVFAVRSPTDLVAPDYYERELRHQAQLDRERNAAAAGVGDFTFDPQSRRLILRFPPGPVSGAVALYRPSAAALDRSLPLAVDSNGVQFIDCAACAPGLWNLQVQWTQSGMEYYREQPLVLP